jgi:acetylornithine deacetylase/succinyl-diaminopimelate desuccinylase family protein
MLEDVLSHLDESYTLNILKDMIRINSVVGQEGELTNYIKNELESFGLKCIIDEVEPNRSNIYVKLESSGKGKKINFNGHLDTIPVVSGWETDPFKPIVKDGKLYGLGSADMKGGISCILNMIRAFIESNCKLKGELSFSAVIDEEAYSKGSKAMLKTDFKNIDAMVIAEPYTGEYTNPIPLGITGKVLYDIYVKGKAAHGFFPQQGINAIEEAAKILNNLEKLHLKEHPKFGKGNYCTLKIEGGYDIYSVVVPASTRIEINRLLVPGETIQSVIDDMDILVESLNLAAQTEVKIKQPKYEPFIMQKDEVIIQIFDKIYKDTLKITPHYGYTRGITDANIFMGEANIKCLNFGPKGDGVHQKNENVSLNWLPIVSTIYTKIAHQFLE